MFWCSSARAQSVLEHAATIDVLFRINEVERSLTNDSIQHPIFIIKADGNYGD